MILTFRNAVLSVAIALLAACSSPASDAPQGSPEPAAAPAVPSEPVEAAMPAETAAPPEAATSPAAAAPVGDSLTVYKSLGRRQCEEGGETAESLAAQLRTAGIEVRSVGCANDGMMYAAMCGGGTGELGVFDIPAADAARAAAAGFKPLSDWPDAQRTACPGVDAKQSKK